MNNLYHFVPEDMRGDTLFPLNELKDIYPDLYEAAKHKYAGREAVMGHKIPHLNCLWNDVLHLTAVHPKEIKNALGTDKNFKAFVVDPYSLDPKDTIVYLYKHEDRNLKMNEDNFSTFNPDEVGKYATLPEETKQYYQEMQNKGERPLLFVRVPHILYKGRIDTSDLEIIEV